MTQLTIATVSICNKDYNTLKINSINTITGTSSILTSINYSINNGSSNMMNGYRDVLVITNPSSVDYNYLIGQLLSITGLTQSL
jgi:hypothetical protein